MNVKPVSPGKGSASSQLETIEKLTQSLIDVVKSLPGDKQDEKLLQLSMRFAFIDFAQLKLQINERPATLPGNEKASLSELTGELTKELEQRDHRIHEFKLSLADSVMDNKSLQRQLQEVIEKKDSLSNQVAQMQMHSKDLTMKLSTASGTISKYEIELETLNSELMDLRSQSYQLKSLHAEYEDQLDVSTKKLAESLATQNRLSLQNEKLSKDYDHVLTSHEMFKHELDAALIRSQELEEAIESLQREKNHLQNRLDKYVLGSKKGVFYHQPADANQSVSSVLKPDEFAPFLPFCFPERLPSAIKFRREIKGTWPACIKKTARPGPVIYPVFTSFKNTELAPHKHISLPTMLIPARAATPLVLTNINPFTAKLPLQPMVCLDKSFDQLVTAHKFTAMIPAQNTFIISKEKRALKVFSNQRFMPNKIYTTSLALYLAHLSSHNTNLVLKDPAKLPFICKKPEIAGNNNRQLKIANFFMEKLAFRHRFQLQSQRLLASEPTFNCSFKKGNKLKSVLETFGNTINLMVQKYDIMATPSAGNGGGVK